MKRILHAGEKVRVSFNPIDPDSPPSFVKDMGKYKGRNVTIARVVDRKRGWYKIKEDREGYTWSDRWLKPLRARKRDAKKERRQ